MTPARGPGRRVGRPSGSATVEFVFIAPFVLTIAALVWDLRDFVSHRTDLAREMYALAEIIANEPDANPIGEVMEQAIDRFEPVSGGRIVVAIVARGTQRADGVACGAAAEWCLPTVLTVWPVEADDGTWKLVGDDCAAAGVPAAGQHFAAGAQVLPNEDADGARTEVEWISRNMRPTEWWVVIDTCFLPDPGLFWGRLVAMRDRLFDVSAFPLRSRVAWGSVHDLGDCAWCAATP